MYKSNTIRRQPHQRPLFAGMRRHERHDVQLRVFIIDDQGWEIPFESINISTSGVFVSSRFFFELGTEHTLVLRAEDDSVVAKMRGRVVRLDASAPDKSQCGMAYEFIDTDVKKTDHLYELVSQL